MDTKNSIIAFIVFSLFVFSPTISQGHSGRRFEVKTENVGGAEKLYAVGYNSSGIDDGGGVVRPYRNAMHDHWSNVFGSATAALPGFDVLAPGSLEGHALYAELVSVSKWVDPPLVDMGGMMMVPDGTIPQLDPLSGESVFVSRNSQLVSSNALGTLTLDNAIAASGEHLDLVYGIDIEPVDVLYSLEWVLSTDAPGVSDSDSIYAILAPAGSNMMEKMHMEALYLEEYLGVSESGGAVPEPSSVILWVGLGLGVGMFRVRRRADGATRYRCNRVKREDEGK